MTPDNNIRDLLGRYATGSLTAEEQKRLFDAALDDQELFDEIAREDEIKQMLAEPGVRDRLIRSLAPPKRRLSWVLALAPVAVLSALLIVVLMRPAPKPQQVAVATIPASPAAPAPVAAPQQTAMSAPQPVSVPERVKAKETEQSRRDEKPEAFKDGLAKEKQADSAGEAVKKDVERRSADQKEAAPKAMDQVAAAPQSKAETQTVEVQAQASQVQVTPAAQQNAPGGPKQNAVQSSRALAPISLGKVATIVPGFGFHYSVQTAGHLIVIPTADGYLSVRSGDGAVLFAPQRIAAGVVIDTALPGGVRTLLIVFSVNATPAPVSVPVYTAPEGDIQRPGVAAIELKLKP